MRRTAAGWAVALVDVALAGVALAAVALAGVALASPARAADAASATQDCRVSGLEHGVQCGSVRRALDPSRPNGSAIDVHFVVVPALARRSLADPVFLLAGGPGQSAIDVAPQVLPLLARLNQRRDLVFVDQRGSGQSAPLVCDDPAHASLAEQADPERQFQQMMDCKSALLRLPWVRDEAALGFFTTTLAMQDLDAVRRRLGATRIDLIGISYGTRAALEYQRQFPQAVRRSVLDAVAPPDMALPASFSTDGQAAFDALLAACEHEPACQARFPSLRRDWSALWASLPRPVVAAHPLTGRPEHLVMTRHLLLASLRGALYVPAVAAALPAALDAAAHGRFEPLLGVGAMLDARPGSSLAMGMHFSVVCAEDLPLLDRSTDLPGADFGRSDADFYRRVCDRWPRGAVPAAFYTVPATTPPVLLLSGGLDPATPPRHAARVARALGPAARQIVVANAGHGVLGIGCVRDIVFRFIDAATDAAALAVDAACVTSIPRPPAFLPTADASRATGVAR